MGHVIVNKAYFGSMFFRWVYYEANKTTHDLAKWSESHGYFGVLVWIIANSLTGVIENIYYSNPSFLILKAFGINTDLA